MNMFKKSAVIGGVLALGLTLASCSGETIDISEPDSTVTQPSAAPETTSPGQDGAGKFAPVIINPATITEGQTVEVMKGNGIDLTVDGDPSMWTGESSDPSVAEFSPGGVSGEATFNPGIQTVAAGETTITLTDGSSGKTITFVVKVTPSTIPDGAVA